MIVSLDIETTGLDARTDEILTVGMCDAETGEEIFHRTYRPSRATSWPEAQAVNGIDPEMVASCPPIEQDAEEIREILADAEAVVVYNTAFDLQFLEAAGALPDRLDVYDPMIDYAPVHGEWNESRGDWRWQRLATAAEGASYDWGDDAAHDALADCRAAAAVWRWLRDRECAHLDVWSTGE